MTGLDRLELLFVAWAFLFQIVLIAHFALRKWAFPVVVKYGWIVYALGVPALVISLVLLLGGKPWALWAAGLIHGGWAAFGYTVEYVKKVTTWRDPIRWPIFGPYVFLYLATIMFYWWPLALLSQPLWAVYAALFVLSTILNVTSHKEAQ